RQQTTEHREQNTDDRRQSGTKGNEKIPLYPPFPKGDSPDSSTLVKGSEGGFEKKIQVKISRDSDLVRLLKTSNDVVIKDELPGIVEVIGQEAIDNISSAMKPFNGEVIAPVFIDNKLSLLIVLGGKLSGDIFTNEDITLLKTVSNQTAIAIKNANLYAEKLRSERFASMGLISATFAHEIRNPLTSIKTFAQLFPEKYMDTDFREVFSKVVVDDVERIDGLIRDLMDFSSGKAILSMDHIDVGLLIDEILTYLEGKLELENKKISVEKIYKDVKINILGDSEKLKQAFINIITNGCQAMGENGVLKVNITPNGREVDIAISDTGNGISQEEISRLFDPFYTTKPMGMGLGLAISKKIIEDHGGRIIVESKISKGTTFTVSLLM
ncbi:MAG: ATP-binding protein, partial [Nitrospirota bacterium]